MKKDMHVFDFTQTTVWICLEFCVDVSWMNPYQSC